MSHYTLKSKKGRLLLLSTISASGLAFIIGSSISVALPDIQSYFDANLSGIQWLLNSYALMLASFIVVGGSLGDRYGRVKIFRIGIGIFTFGALISGFATSLLMLILFQIVVGAGAAMMIPGSLALINASFDQKHQGTAIGLWAGLSGGMAAIGPLLGGLLVENFGWQSVFFIIVPLGILTYLTSFAITESINKDAKNIDVVGSAAIMLTFLGFSFALIFGPEKGWTSAIVVVAGLLFIASLIFLIFHEMRSKNPLIPPKMLRNPLVLGANVVTLVLYLALNAVLIFFILNLQQIQGFSPTMAGLAMLPPILIITFLAGPAGAIADKIGPRKQMIAGPLIVGIGIALMMTGGTDANYYIHFLPGLLLFGFGMATVIAPLTKCALMVPEKWSGVASGVNNTVSRMSTLLAVAIIGALMVTLFTSSLTRTIQVADLSTEKKILITTQASKLGGIEIPESFSTSEMAVSRQAVDSAFIRAFRTAMGLSALLAIFGSLVSYVSIREKYRHKFLGEK